MNENPASYFEIAKLVVDFVTPIIVLILGIFVSRGLKQFETRVASNQELVRRRVGFCDSVSQRLDTVFCFFLYVGNWRDVDPPKVISIKRELDSEFHRAIPYLSEGTYHAYSALEAVCFRTG